MVKFSKKIKNDFIFSKNNYICGLNLKREEILNI